MSVKKLTVLLSYSAGSVNSGVLFPKIVMVPFILVILKGSTILPLNSCGHCGYALDSLGAAASLMLIYSKDECLKMSLIAL